MKKILVPVDFSSASQAAFRVACQLAQKTEATVVLLNVNEMVAAALPIAEYAYVGSAMSEVEENYRSQVKDRFNAFVEEANFDTDFGDIKLEFISKEGLLTPIITAMVEEDEMDMVVMGTLGASGWKEALIGSNTEKVIRYAPCPVLVIPEGVNELRIEKVVVPSTLKSDQIQVFEMVKYWQALFGFDIEILYINDPLNTPTHGGVEAEKKRIIDRVGLQHVYLHSYGLTWSEEQAILDYVDEVNADMLVMGTHQRRGVSHLMFGSVTEDTANHTHKPLLAIPLN
jgi:nucleotide-binding universal stress UspA family protein